MLRTRLPAHTIPSSLLTVVTHRPSLLLETAYLTDLFQLLPDRRRTSALQIVWSLLAIVSDDLAN